jgi:uncharacterized protein (DUF1501 family)
MNHASPLYTRRAFLRTGLLGGALTATAPTFLLQTMQRLHAATLDSAIQTTTGTDGPILVVLQLSGGNDGLNTLIPLGNDHYYRARPTLGIPAAEALPLDEHYGLHPAMNQLHALFREGRAAALHGVGYPNPNRSHFRSMEIWHTATDSDRASNRGWLGRYFDAACSGCDPAVAIHLGKENPQAFAASIPKGISFEANRPLAFDDPMHETRMMMGDDEDHASAGGSITTLRGGGGTTQIDALDFIERTALHAQVSTEQIKAITGRTRNATSFPNSRLGRDLGTVAQLIGGGMPTRIYYVSLGGFDTHANQAGAHRNLLATLSEAVAAFLYEMDAQGNRERVLLLTFSEFGRRVSENAGRGTDHGAAAPVFLFGGAIRPGLHGTQPNLAPDALKQGDPVFTTDFRSVYADLLARHLQADPRPILGRPFPKTTLFA